MVVKTDTGEVMNLQEKKLITTRPKIHGSHRKVTCDTSDRSERLFVTIYLLNYGLIIVSNQ